MTDLLNEVQQVKIMGGEQSNSELKIYLGKHPTPILAV